MKKLILSASMLALTAGATAHAAGFSIDTQHARASGMGTAVTAFIDDPSAVFYNPAGIVQGEGLKLALGDTLILPRLTVQYAGQEKVTMNPPPSLPPHLYATYGITRDLSVGLGLFTPFGSSTKWPDNWFGRYETTGSSLQTFYLNPEVAYRIHERIRIGAGVQLARATVKLSRDQNFIDNSIGVELGGGAWGVGANAGVQVDIIPRKLWAGAAWRSGVKFGFKGDVHFSGVPEELQGVAVDGPITTDITLPQSVNLGVAYQVTPTVKLSAQVDWFDHSSINAIDIRREDGSSLSLTPKNWNDAMNYHLGVEWMATPELAVRGGFVYDPSPSPVETLRADIPDADRIKPTIGVGYKLGNFRGDLAYQFLYLLEKDALGGRVPATMGGTAHVAGLTLGFEM